MLCREFSNLQIFKSPNFFSPNAHTYNFPPYFCPTKTENNRFFKTPIIMILPLTAPEGQLSITSILRKNPNRHYAKEVKEYSSKMTMHITGLNLAHYLAKIDYFEKQELLEL